MRRRQDDVIISGLQGERNKWQVRNEEVRKTLRETIVGVEKEINSIYELLEKPFDMNSKLEVETSLRNMTQHIAYAQGYHNV